MRQLFGSAVGVPVDLFHVSLRPDPDERFIKLVGFRVSAGNIAHSTFLHCLFSPMCVVLSSFSILVA